MSFLLDPPLLVAAGAAIEHFTPDERTADRLEAGVTGVFIGVSSGLYANHPSTRWLWELCRAETGRDWMLNSGVFRFRHADVGWRTHLLSAAIFATYPLWPRLGRKLARNASASASGRISPPPPVAGNGRRSPYAVPAPSPV